MAVRRTTRGAARVSGRDVPVVGAVLPPARPGAGAIAAACRHQRSEPWPRLTASAREYAGATPRRTSSLWPCLADGVPHNLVQLPFCRFNAGFDMSVMPASRTIGALLD